MPKSSFNNIQIEAVACAMPTTMFDNTKCTHLFDEDEIKRNIEITGIHQHPHCAPEQTAADLAFAAAEKIIQEKNIDRNEIGVLVFATDTPDYISPSSAFVLQSRLNLSKDCIAFDVNLVCSAYVYGLQLVSSLLSSTKGKYGLLLTGTVNKVDYIQTWEKPDPSYVMMFGDAASATLLQTSPDAPQLDVWQYADGSGFKNLIIPAGGTRNPFASREPELWADGHMHTEYEPHMRGMDVFVFATTTVPRTIKKVFQETETTPDDYDVFLLHQANRMILQRIAKSTKIPMEKVPLSLEEYGNCNGSSIPVTMAFKFGASQEDKEIKTMMCGFGVGLSWGVATATINTKNIFPILFTDEYYTDGAVEHE